jgi:hypothetical protein
MKTFNYGVVFASVLFLAASAGAVTINDGYVGGTPTDPADFGKDIIGTPSAYDVSHMDVQWDSGLLVVKIYSQFFDNVGISGIELGDLFISTDGWNPFGAAPYPEDNRTNGEDWEVALVLDDHGEGDHGPGVDFAGRSGVLSAFVVDPAGIEETFLLGTSYRQFQEAQYNPVGQQQAFALGTWGIFDELGEYDSLIMSINLGRLLEGFDGELGFHWTMTCGNDVIEGGAAVPEPSSMLLLGGALLGGVFCRKKRA